MLTALPDSNSSGKGPETAFDSLRREAGRFKGGDKPLPYIHIATRPAQTGRVLAIGFLERLQRLIFVVEDLEQLIGPGDLEDVFDSG